MGTAAGSLRGGAVDAGQASPMVSRLLAGLTLRRLREGQGLSCEAAGQAIGVPAPEISRLEQGRAGFRMRDLVGLCTLYGVTDQIERVTLLGLARRANSPEWWHVYRDVIPPWFERYLGLEQAASVIRSYEVQFIPGLLQTREYARAVLALGHRNAPQRDFERRVELRMRRQDVLHRPRPVHLGGHPAAGGPVTVLRLPERQLPDVAYLEQLTSARYCDQPAEPEYYRHTMDRLAIQAATAGHPGAILSGILGDI